MNYLNFLIESKNSKEQRENQYDKLEVFHNRTKLKAQKAGGQKIRAKNHAKTEKQENDFVIVEFPNANPKRKSPSLFTPEKKDIIEGNGR